MAGELHSSELALLYTRHLILAADAIFMVPILICSVLLCSAEIFVSAAEVTRVISECSVERYNGVSLLQLSISYSVTPRNSTCYMAMRGQYDMANTSQNPSRQLNYTLVIIADRAQEDSLQYCGFCPALQSDYSQIPTLASSTTRNESSRLTVRHCINQRLTKTSFDPLQNGAAVATTNVNPRSWLGAMAWTFDNLSLIVDESCASRDLHVIRSSAQAWNICGPRANGFLTRIGSSMRQLILFAQDRVLSSYVPLPVAFTCREWKDYEWILAIQDSFGPQGNGTLRITLYTIPMDNSCQMLCIAEMCLFDLSLANEIYYVMNDSRPLTVRYKVRSAASNCDPNSYSGFVVLINWPFPWAFNLSTYELDSPFRYSDVRNVTEGSETPTPLDLRNVTDGRKTTTYVPVQLSASYVGAIAASCVVVLVALVTTLVFVVRWRTRLTQQQSQAVDLATTTTGFPAKIGNPLMRSSETSPGGRSDRAVTCAGKYSPAATAVTRSARRDSAGSFATAPPGGSTSEQYEEIMESEPPPSEQQNSPSGSSPFFQHGRKDNLIKNFIPTHHLSHSTPTRNLSPPEYITLSGPDGPEVHYASLVPSADSSLYCDLQASSGTHATRRARSPKSDC